jgi:hypothetical protein
MTIYINSFKVHLSLLPDSTLGRDWENSGKAGGRFLCAHANMTLGAGCGTEVQDDVPSFKAFAVLRRGGVPGNVPGRWERRGTKRGLRHEYSDYSVSLPERLQPVGMRVHVTDESPRALGRRLRARPVVSNSEDAVLR